LRMQGVRNTGEVETAILESNGRLSVFRLTKPVNGTALLPPNKTPASKADRKGRARKNAGSRQTP
jgi:uncharacterized membrane protein YcaP (DUF421 family)